MKVVSDISAQNCYWMPLLSLFHKNEDDGLDYSSGLPKNVYNLQDFSCTTIKNTAAYCMF